MKSNLARCDYPTSSERPQKIDHLLLLLHTQPLKMLNHPIGLAPFAPMLPNRFHQIARSPIVQEKHPLPNSPQRRRPKLIWPRAALRNPIRQSASHVVHQQVRVQIRRLI